MVVKMLPVLCVGLFAALPAHATMVSEWIGKHPLSRIDGDTFFGAWTAWGGSGCDNIPMDVLRGNFTTVQGAPEVDEFGYTVVNCETTSCLSGGRSNSGAFFLTFHRSDSLMYYAGNGILGTQYCLMTYRGRYLEGKFWTCYLVPGSNIKFNEMKSAQIAILLQSTFQRADADPKWKPTGLQPWPPSYAIGC